MSTQQLDPSKFTWEKYCSQVGHNLWDCWNTQTNRPKPGYTELGRCPASRLVIRPRPEGEGVMLRFDETGEEFWLHGTSDASWGIRPPEPVGRPIPALVIVEEPREFIAHDSCGWNEQFGRFTHMPSGSTLTCKEWMRQADWDQAQLEWFMQWNRGLVVHRCNDGPYTETGNSMGTVDEIITRLTSKLS